MTVWVYRGPLQDPFRWFQFGTWTHVRIHACGATVRRWQASPDQRLAALPPGKPPVPPKPHPPLHCWLHRSPAVPPGSRGAPYNSSHGAAARRPSGGVAVHLGLTEGLQVQGGRVCVNGLVYKGLGSKRRRTWDISLPYRTAAARRDGSNSQRAAFCCLHDADGLPPFIRCSPFLFKHRDR